MWKLMLPVAEEVRTLARRKGSVLAADGNVEPSLAPAYHLERMGRAVELVCKTIRSDAETNGNPMVISNDRQTASDLLTMLLADKSQRDAYLGFLKITLPTIRHEALPDDRVTSYILERRWSQLSSSVLGQLLLNAAALVHLGKRMQSEPPAAWAEILRSGKGSGRPDTADAKSGEATARPRGRKANLDADNPPKQ